LKILPYFIFFLLVTLVGVFAAYGQEPTYFKLGEKELVNTDVYSICQTENQLLYISTNQGLFVYKHGEFQQVPGAKEQFGNSLFDLKLDNNGDLFCGNLSGQIFKLVNDHLELFFELGSDFTNLGLMYTFDRNNHLIIVSLKKCLDVFEGKSNLVYTAEEGVYCLNRLLDGRIIIGTGSADSIVSFKDGIINKSYVDRGEFRKEFVSYTNSTLLIEDKLLSAYETGRIQFLGSDDYKNNVPPIKNERHFQFNKKEIWALDHSSGLRKFSLNNDNKLVVSDSYFDQQFISTMTIGSNGTLFLGTFGNGIIVVPNESTQRHIIEGNDAKIAGITTDENNNVFLSTRDGRIMHYNSTTEIVESLPGVSMDHIFYAKGIDFGINKNNPSIVYDGKPWNDGDYSFGSVKDIYRVDTSSVFIATSNGVFKVGQVMDGIAWDAVDYHDIYHLSSFMQRCKSVAYSKEDQSLYVATLSGVIQVDAFNKRQEILYNNKDVICKDLMFYQNQLWCATLNQGILIFKNGKFLRKIDERNGLGNNDVNKIELHKSKIYISHKTGFQILDLKSDKWTTLGTAEGIINGSVHDFALSDDKLWILSDGQPLSLNLDDLPQKKPELNILLDSIVVSNERLKDFDSRTFSYSQNQFSFYVDFKGIEYESETTIEYRIKGFENKWNSLPATSTLIEYKYLPPGKYVFEIKTRYRDQKSKTRSYSFVIAPPYWQTLWFYMLIGLALAVLLISLYLYQIRRIGKRNKEKLEKQRIQTDLLESELKALRSQMNPHFIFNSLNSIQDLILQQDTNASYDYIVLFADLVRSTLNYSNKDFIAIEKELDFLDVYLSLEKLRFEEDFNYEIKYKGMIDVNVPSLIVQPFIENALVHGLLHKEGQKKLVIEFEYTDKLICTVTDNGVGRQRANEIQDRRGNHHESFALDAINKRLSILSEQHGKQVGYIVHDLFDGETPSGTKVVITMPFKDQF
jgi:hypothetical protein